MHKRRGELRVRKKERKKGKQLLESARTCFVLCNMNARMHCMLLGDGKISEEEIERKTYIINKLIRPCFFSSLIN